MGEPRPRFCAYCSKASGEEDLCDTCLQGIVRYPEQNQVIFDAYLKRGVAQFDHLLERHAEFAARYPDHHTT